MSSGEGDRAPEVAQAPRWLSDSALEGKNSVLCLKGVSKAKQGATPPKSVGEADAETTVSFLYGHGNPK